MQDISAEFKWRAKAFGPLHVLGWQDFGDIGCRLAGYLDPTLGVNPLDLRNAAIRWIHNLAIDSGAIEAEEIVSWQLILGCKTEPELRFSNEMTPSPIWAEGITVKYIDINLGRGLNGIHKYIAMTDLSVLSGTIILNRDVAGMDIRNFIADAPEIKVKLDFDAVCAQYQTEVKFIRDFVASVLQIDRDEAYSIAGNKVLALAEAGDMESINVYDGMFLRSVVNEARGEG